MGRVGDSSGLDIHTIEQPECFDSNTSTCANKAGAVVYHPTVFSVWYLFLCHHEHYFSKPHQMLASLQGLHSLVSFVAC